MKNKLIILFTIIILGLNANSNCSEVNNNQNVCIDQNNKIIHCLYYDVCENKYYTINDNNEKQVYLPEDEDVILDLFYDSNDGFYACDKYGKKYKYSPQDFKFIQSNNFYLHVVHKRNNIIRLRPYFYIDIDYIRNIIELNNNSDTTDSTRDNTSLAI